MHGQEERIGSLISPTFPQKTGSRPPIPKFTRGETPDRSGPRPAQPHFLQALPGGRQTLDSAGSAAFDFVAASDLWHSLRADADRAAQLQPAVAWFVDLNPDDPVWHPTTFTKNQDRLLQEELVARFLECLLVAPEVKPLLSSEHFSVDGTCYGPRPPTVHWGGSVAQTTLRRRPVEARDLAATPPERSAPRATSVACCSPTRPTAPPVVVQTQSSPLGAARLFKKAPGVGAFLSFMGHCAMGNRDGLVVAGEVSQATGRAERDAVLRMTRSFRGSHQKTLGAAKGHDTREFVTGLRISGITPHVAQARHQCPIDQRWEHGSSRFLAGSNRQLQARGSSKVRAVFQLHAVA